MGTAWLRFGTIDVPAEVRIDRWTDGHDVIHIDRHRNVAIVRSTEAREVEITHSGDVWTAAPEGWQAISVRPA